MKHHNLVDEYFNEVIYYGGLPLRRGDAITDLDEVAKSTGERNWLPIRDAGLMGLEFFNRRHPMPPDTEPITLDQLYQIRGIVR